MNRLEKESKTQIDKLVVIFIIHLALTLESQLLEKSMEKVLLPTANQSSPAATDTSEFPWFDIILGLIFAGFLLWVD